jgi:hypothetical protein
MTPPPARDDDALGPPDRALIEAIRTHDAGLRALLCTLARHGVAMRRAEPARARAWLDALATHPFYKAGQFLFDLLEWEDFMLDAEAPPLLDAAAALRALDRVAQALRAVGAAIDGQAPEDAEAGVEAGAETGDRASSEADAGAMSGVPVAAESLPALEPGFYLYPSVVLGALALVTRAG